jgi:excisionase family DNA binding protein
MKAPQLTTVLTIDDLASYLKISKSTLYKLAQEGALPGQKVGKHWRFHRDAVDDWLRTEPVAAKRLRTTRKPR